jgi:hypothetical protein
MRLWSLVLVLGCAACGGNEPAAPVATGAASNAGGNSPGGGSGGDGAGASGGDGTPDGGTASGGAGASGNSGSIEPGTPEVLVDGLDYPPRIALDGDDLYVANARRLSNAASTDALLRVATGGGSPEMWLEAGSIDGFLVDTNRIWVASRVEHALLGFDKASGERDFELGEPTEYPAQPFRNTTHLFLALSGPPEIRRLNLTGEDPAPIWLGATGSIQWVRATSTDVFFIVQNQGGPSALMRVGVNGANPEALVERTTLFGGFELTSEDVIFLDYDGGTVERVAQSGGDPSLVEEIAGPWAVSVDDGVAYVSSQTPPGYCNETIRGAINRVPLDGGDSEVLVDDLPCPSHSIVTSEALYWVNNGDSTMVDGELTPAGNGSVMKLVSE